MSDFKNERIEDLLRINAKLKAALDGDVQTAIMAAYDDGADYGRTLGCLSATRRTEGLLRAVGRLVQDHRAGQHQQDSLKAVAKQYDDMVSAGLVPEQPEKQS